MLISHALTPALPPEVYPLGVDVLDIYDIPAPNTVGSSDLDNAVTLFTLADGDLRAARVDLPIPEGAHIAAGDIRPLPLPSAERFGYAQSRGVMLFDIACRTAARIGVCHRLEEVIHGVHELDPTSGLYLFEIKLFGESSGVTGPAGPVRILRVVDLSSVKARVLAEKREGALGSAYVEPIAAGDGAIFVYSRANHAITALTVQLVTRAHPFAVLFTDNRDSLRLLTEICLHQSLPMAVIVDRDPARNRVYRIHLALWAIDNPCIIPMPFPNVNKENLYCSHVEFSPDGSWLVYRDETASDLEPVFVGMPIVSDKPPYLGPPRNLGTTFAGPPASTCWIADPLSFVACDGAALYRWRLDRLR